MEENYTPRKVLKYVWCPLKGRGTTLAICKKCVHHLGMIDDRYVKCSFGLGGK